MKRNRLLLICVACLAAVLLAACGNSQETSTDSSVSTQVTATPEQSDTADDSQDSAQEPESEYPAEDAEPVLEESRLGYSMTYDPTVFTLDDTAEDKDTYTYNTAEELNGQVYIAVQSYSDKDAQTLAEEIAAQSGQEGIAPETTTFGADGLETFCVHYEEEVDGVTQTRVFYAISLEEGSLLVEITSPVDVSMEIQGKLEEMTGTFKLL